MSEPINALPPYDPDRACEKCGQVEEAGTRYCGGPLPYSPTWNQTCERAVVRHIDVEHLHRICGRCGYEWLEATFVPEPEKPARRSRRRGGDEEADET